MRHAATVIAAFATCLVATGAGARPFYVVQSGPDSWTVMDPQSIERVGTGPVRKAWAIRVQRNILSGNPPQAGYVRTLSEYDCEAQRVRWREFTAFARSGTRLMSKVNPQPEWAPAIEDADISAAYRVICEGVGGGAVVSADSVAKVVISLMGSWDPPPAPAGSVPSLPPAKAAPVPKPGAKAVAPAPKPR
jgi:hypothetical protein